MATRKENGLVEMLHHDTAALPRPDLPSIKSTPLPRPHTRHTWHKRLFWIASYRQHIWAPGKWIRKLII